MCCATLALTLLLLEHSLEYVGYSRAIPKGQQRIRPLDGWGAASKCRWMTFDSAHTMSGTMLRLAQDLRVSC